MIIQSNCKFFDNTNTPTVSKTFQNAAGDVLSLQIFGADSVIHIEGRNSMRGDWVPLAGINLSDFSIAKGTYTKSGLYEIGIEGVRMIRARLESTSGNVSAMGQIISTGEF